MLTPQKLLFKRKLRSDNCAVVMLTLASVTLVQQGFWYHHAEPKYLMLVFWIPQGDHTLPANATHRVGVGAFVMNDKREVCPIHLSGNAGYLSAFKMCIVLVVLSRSTSDVLLVI